MTVITSSLVALGLAEAEAALYEVGLRQGETDVATLSRVLHMNRATAYHYIHSLEQKGLVHKRTENGRILISMLREEGLQSYFDFEEAKAAERKQQLQALFARLPAQKKAENRPDVQYFSGYEGVRMALEIAFRATSKHWDIIAPKKNFFSDIEESYATYYLAQRKRRGISSRSLWEKTAENIRVSNEIARERAPRYLPKKYTSPFHAVLILFDSRALFISSTKEMQAVLINSADMCSTLQMQFNVLWKLSEPAQMQ